MEDGRTREIDWSFKMAKELAEASESGVTAYQREIVDAEAKLLSDVSDAEQNMSLDSFMFYRQVIRLGRGCETLQTQQPRRVAALDPISIRLQEVRILDLTEQLAGSQ